LRRRSRRPVGTIQFFDQAEADPASPCPDIVIPDINLPKRQGGDELNICAAGPAARRHVIVVSRLASECHQEFVKALGTDGYFRKPSEFDEFMKLGDRSKAYSPAA